MKRCFLVLLVVCFVVFELIAQQGAAKIVKYPLLYENMTINDLMKQDSIVLRSECIGDDLIFAKLNIEGKIYEYFRINDSTFLSTIFLGEDLIGRGRVVLAYEAENTDTIPLFDPINYEENPIVMSTHKLVKINDWLERKGQLEWKGSYAQNLKQGWWTEVRKNSKNNRSLRYNKGKIVELKNPTKEDFINHQKFIVGKQLHWCSRLSMRVSQSLEGKTVTNWELKQEKEGDCSDLGVFEFKADGTLDFSSKNKTFTGKYFAEGVGQWNIDDNGVLSLISSEKRNVKFDFVSIKDGNLIVSKKQ